MIAIFLFRNGLPADAEDAAGTLVLAVAAAAPPVVLFLLSVAVRALAELPARVRALPETGVEHAADLRRAGGAAAGVRGWRGLVRLPLLLWRLALVAGSTRERLTPYATAAPLVSPPFLVVAGVAAVAALVEIAVALVLLARLVIP